MRKTAYLVGMMSAPLGPGSTLLDASIYSSDASGLTQMGDGFVYVDLAKADGEDYGTAEDNLLLWLKHDPRRRGLLNCPSVIASEKRRAQDKARGRTVVSATPVPSLASPPWAGPRS